MNSLNRLAFIINVFLLVGVANASPKVTQAALVEFGSNSVTVLAVEEFGKPPSMLFIREGLKEKDTSSSIQFSEHVASANEFAYVNSFLRFRSFKFMRDLPVIVAMAFQPSGTDEWAEVKIISEKGKIVVLNPNYLTISLQDGIYLGYINKKYGYGMLTWHFNWEDSAHYAPHKYEICIYQLNTNSDSFVLKKKIITKRKFETGKDALKHFGLPSKNIRDEIIRVGEDTSTLGIEKELFQSEETTTEP